MGWVDQHNRRRQAMLRLDQVWRTMRHQTRMKMEIMALSVVDAFLACRTFMPKWRDTPNDESVFDKFLLAVIPQLDRRAEEELLTTAAADDDVAGQCQQVPTGRRFITEGANSVRTTDTQQRCGACKAEGRKEVNKHGEPTSVTPRTSYTCTIHPGVHCCHSTKVLTHPERGCWQRHLQSHDAVEE